MPCQNTPYTGTTWLQKAPPGVYNTQVSDKSDERAWMDNSSSDIDGALGDMIAAMFSLSLTRAQEHSRAPHQSRHAVGAIMLARWR